MQRPGPQGQWPAGGPGVTRRETLVGPGFKFRVLSSLTGRSQVHCRAGFRRHGVADRETQVMVVR
eukprot:3813531-Rhodomonas_salina.4